MLTNKDNLLNPANPHAGLVYSICVVKFNIKYEPQPLNGEGLNLNLNLNHEIIFSENKLWKSIYKLLLHSNYQNTCLIFNLLKHLQFFHLIYLMKYLKKNLKKIIR